MGNAMVDVFSFQLKEFAWNKKIHVVGGWVVLSGINSTSWLHLASWNLPDSQLQIQIGIYLKYELDVYLMFISFSVNIGWLSELI